MTARFAMILMDGAGDDPIAALDGRTPLEAADTPNCDDIARTGRQGTVRTIPPGFPPLADVALWSLLGHRPASGYCGRGPIEAAALRIRLGRDDVALRCDFVTLADGVLVDPTAGGLPASQAQRLVEALNAELAGPLNVSFHRGPGHASVLVVHAAAGFDVTTSGVDEVTGQPVREHLPRGRGGDRLRTLLTRAAAVLEAQDVNLVRRDLGENPANGIWPWGAGRTPRWRRFRQRFGVGGAVVAGTATARGLALLNGLAVVAVPTATGDLDTDFAAKGAAAAKALADYELVIVHVQAPAEAARRGRPHDKAAAIARIDRDVVGPLRETLRADDPWRIMVAATRVAFSNQRRQTSAAPPFCMAGHHIEPRADVAPFSERAAQASDLHVAVGSDLMEHFLRL